ncbi:NRAMP family divalent metal transporter [Pandoraea cepalis]|uniref:Divalent metal cation transporter MntH n=1 Tax=Pandoraea cepalis TaxID=2508294 RepID=A0A5E4UQ87_9BURK|nr:divalent metal cation transporter [Pandoraea cepalis]VVE01055.1 Divalent metal cation transporter MntH [Pandoraea cepalis]
MSLDRTALHKNQSLWEKLGPGLIAGAADDDPSGVATYSQVGAAFGYGLLWTALATYPLMIGIQVVSAQIGRVTGDGIAANIRKHYPGWILYVLVGLLLVANTINIAADVGAMGAALKLLIGGPAVWYAVAFGMGSLTLQVFIPFPRYAPILKVLTLALLAYVATVFSVKISWGDVLYRTVLPDLSFNGGYIVAVVAVFGTTISPYMFFWQASQEVEVQRATKGQEPLTEAPSQARRNLRRIRIDTYIGMAFSNVIAFFIILTSAVTLYQHGVRDIQTSAQAAAALRPLAGEVSFLLFSAGIIGCGLLAVPVLAGSSAYAVAEAFEWRIGLGREVLQARGFYMILTLATVLGLALNFTAIDPIKALFWSAVINGVIAVPIMTILMLMAGRRDVMGKFAISLRLKALGWLATGTMACAVLTMFATWGQ